MRRHHGTSTWILFPKNPGIFGNSGGAQHSVGIGSQSVFVNAYGLHSLKKRYPRELVGPFAHSPQSPTHHQTEPWLVSVIVKVRLQVQMRPVPWLGLVVNLRACQVHCLEKGFFRCTWSGGPRRGGGPPHCRPRGQRAVEQHSNSESEEGTFLAFLEVFGAFPGGLRSVFPSHTHKAFAPNAQNGLFWVSPRDQIVPPKAI